MKTERNIIVGIGLLLSLFSFFACDNAKDEEFGSALLYIPQAVLQSGGTNNHYFVTIEASAKEDTIVAVGLYRSGLQKLESVTVDVGIDERAFDEAVSLSATDETYALFANAQLLPKAYYSLPASMSLQNGERDGWVELKVDKSALLQAWSDPGLKYVLPVRITNPTKYELNEKLSIAMFIFQRK